jgi:hypothetical protein
MWISNESNLHATPLFVHQSVMLVNCGRATHLQHSAALGTLIWMHSLPHKFTGNLGLGRYTEKYRNRGILYSGRRYPRLGLERELGIEPGAAGSTLSRARRFKSR